MSDSFPKTSGCFRLKMTKDLTWMFPHLLQLFILKDLQFSSEIIHGLEKCVFRKYSLNKHLTVVSYLSEVNCGTNSSLVRVHEQ